jgi:hypothetical protein
MSKGQSLLWDELQRSADVRRPITAVGASSNRSHATCPHSSNVSLMSEGQPVAAGGVSSNGSLVSDDPSLLWELLATTPVSRAPRVATGR